MRSIKLNCPFSWNMPVSDSGASASLIFFTIAFLHQCIQISDGKVTRHTLGSQFLDKIRFWRHFFSLQYATKIQLQYKTIIPECQSFLKEDHGHAEKNPFERKTLHRFAPFCTSLMCYYYTGENGKWRSQSSPMAVTWQLSGSCLAVRWQLLGTIDSDIM